MRSRGLSLPAVLIMATLAAMVAFTLAAVTQNHLRFARQLAIRQDATYLAEAAAAETLSRLHQDGNFGDDVVVQPDAARFGRVTFRSDRGIPHSTNNLDGRNGTGFNNANVPAGAVHVLATGQSGRETALVEVLVHVPRFPYAVAVAGPFQSSGTLIIRAADSMSEFVVQERAPSAQPMPTHLLSNSSINVAGQCQVTGDVITPGQVQLPPDSEVGGIIRTVRRICPRFRCRSSILGINSIRRR